MRLIDADILEDKFYPKECEEECACCRYASDTHLGYTCHLIKDAPTVEAFTRQQINQIKYEIYQEVGNIDRSKYNTERAQGRADGIIFAMGMAIGIIAKYCDGQQEADTQDLHK